MMAILGFADEFEFNVKGEDRVYKGTLREYTYKEKKELEKKHKKAQKVGLEAGKLLSKIDRLDRLIKLAEEEENTRHAYGFAKKQDELSDELTLLVEENQSLGDENEAFRVRLEACLGGDDKDDILALGEKYGYEEVFKVILEGIEEKKSKPKRGLKNG